ncbi:hypothetical protein J2Z48_000041 [Croceifilum oryzae]|uniref:Peptidase M1 membrane alanine aminopeptidase domain-containing protein n=1 Tax=Croceifilum oryzae TaxID=1553429 RepID=A0AAJ1WR35_9BACL|nr:M1 family metallopeptidase [Croceifilum oryzae]MDQ0415883.1 hypothetical protein [Croceifilum oryzae]
MKRWTRIVMNGIILSTIAIAIKSLPNIDKNPNLFHMDVKEKSSEPRTQYQIQAELDHQQHTIRASETVSLKSKSSQDLDDLVFHLYPNSYNQVETMSNMLAKPDPKLIAKEIQKNPSLTKKDFLGDIEVKDVSIRGKKVTYTQEKQVLKIQLPDPIQPNEHVEVKIDFVVKIPYGFQRLHYRDDFYSITKWYPILAMYDSKTGKWDEKPYYPDGESDFSELSDYHMELKVPKEMTVAATGTEKEDINQNEKIIQVNAPNVREFVFFASPHYEKETRKVAGITVNSYYDKRNAQSREIAVNGLNMVEKALSFFNEKFGPYAYPEFDIMETRVLGVNMEYPTIIQMGDYSNKATKLSFVHELAHQWFYGMIGNDPYQNPALDEAFAVFADQYFNEYDTKGKNGFKHYLSDKNESIVRLPGVINRPLNQYGPNEYGKYIYGKGGIALIDLYYKVGEQKFDQIMKTYFEKNKFTNATFANFFDVVSQVAGKENADYIKKAFSLPDYHPTHLQKR